MNDKNEPINSKSVLFSDITHLIIEARQRTAMLINSELSLLYWSIGQRILTEILQSGKAVYGDQTIKQLSEQMTLEFGTGWSDKQLRHCLHAVETFPNEEKFYALRRLLIFCFIIAL